MNTENPLELSGEETETELKVPDRKGGRPSGPGIGQMPGLPGQTKVDPRCDP